MKGKVLQQVPAHAETINNPRKHRKTTWLRRDSNPEPPQRLFNPFAAFIVCAVVGRKSLSPANQESIEEQQDLLEIRPCGVIGKQPPCKRGLRVESRRSQVFSFAFLDYLLFRRVQVLAAVPFLSSLPISRPICLFNQLA